MTVLDHEPRTQSTQRERVKGLLRSAGADGVCSLFFYSVGLPNGRNRVQELRDEVGLAIETKPCDLRFHERGTPAHVRYVWRWNASARQLALI
jgi:hypothetical protein